MLLYTVKVGTIKSFLMEAFRGVALFFFLFGHTLRCLSCLPCAARLPPAARAWVSYHAYYAWAIYHCWATTYHCPACPVRACPSCPCLSACLSVCLSVPVYLSVCL